MVNPKPRLRVWLLTNAPSPYQVELFDAINANREIELSVRFLQNQFRGYKIESRGLTRVFKGLGAHRDELRFHPGALLEIMSGKQDVYVLSGLYTSPTVILSAVLVFLIGGRYLLWLERPSERNRRDVSGMMGVIRVPFVLARSVLLRLLFAGAYRVVCIGSKAALQYRELGLSAKKTEIIPYCCNTERFVTIDLEAVKELRKTHHLEGQFVFLFSGELSHRKGVDRLFEAYANVAAIRANTVLLILGNGPLRESLENTASAIKSGRVLFAGHLDQSVLPQYFRCADAFVFPSRHDGWAVVVNEAIASGLPIIASNQTGAAHDLVVENENGFRMDTEDVESLQTKMVYLIDNPATTKQFGKRSFELAKSCSLGFGVSAWTKLLFGAVKRV